MAFWTGVTAQNRAWGAVAYSPTLGQWLALSGASSFSSPARGMTSIDNGATWQNVNSGNQLWFTNMDGDGHPGAGCQYHGLCWDPATSQYLGVGVSEEASDNEYLMLYYSSDGATWNRRLIDHFNSGGLFGNGIIVANGPVYMVAFWTAASGTVIYTSPDLTTWTKTTVPANMLPGAAVYAGGQWVVVGKTVNSGGSPADGVPIITSPDGTTWTGRMGFTTGFTKTAWVGLAFTPTGYVATAAHVNGSGAAMTSGDGFTWTLQTMPTLSGLSGSLSGWSDLAYLSGIGLVAINGNDPGTVLEGSAISTDGGVTWNLLVTPQQAPPSNATSGTIFDGVVAANGILVAISQSAQLYHVLTLLGSIWYYNPGTNHYSFGPNPGPPWIPQTPTLLLNCATGVNPLVGVTAGGTLLTLTGSGFGDGATVTLDGVALTGLVVVDQTTITGLTPPHAAGLVNLVLTNPDGGAVTCTFTYANGLLDMSTDSGGIKLFGVGIPSGGFAQTCVDTLGHGTDSGGGSGCVDGMDT